MIEPSQLSSFYQDPGFLPTNEEDPKEKSIRQWQEYIDNEGAETACCGEKANDIGICPCCKEYDEGMTAEEMHDHFGAYEEQ